MLSPASLAIQQDGWFRMVEYGENMKAFLKSLDYPDYLIEDFLRSNETTKFKITDQGLDIHTYLG